MTLTAYSKQQLSEASRDAITDAMGQLPLDATPPRWLLQGQKYSDANIADALRADQINGTVDDSALAQRIAASVPSHVMDGWSYFGRAIHCLIRGDTRNSVHLGYYAELRAALAIMAAEGIGIFDRQHFIIDKDGVSQRLCTTTNTPTASGTHKIIWPVYRWWYQQGLSLDLVTSIIQPGGNAISHWFNSPSGRYRHLFPSTGEWLKDWGIDLKRMDQDSKARNASSYGPSAIHNWQILLGVEAVDTVKRLWGLFRPHYSSPFYEVDRLILHRVLRDVFAAQTKRKKGSKGWTHDFNVFVDDFLEEQIDPQIVGPNRPQWEQFLCDDEAGNGFLLESAGRRSTADASSFPVEVLARAALLLRIATGSCGLHMNKTGTGWDSYAFWLDGLGVRRGFWERGAYPDDPIELWTDIGDALDALDEAPQDGDREEDSPHGARSHSPARSLTKLEECERIGLWGFGI